MKSCKMDSAVIKERLKNKFHSVTRKQSQAQSFSDSRLVAGRDYRIMEYSLNVLISCSKNIQRNAIIPESLQANNH